MQYAEHSAHPYPAEAAGRAPVRLWAELRQWLASAEIAGMPPHVCKAVVEQRRRNEILVGWVQMALIAIFATLYALSRKTFSPDAAFHPVPWALGAYTMFTLFRLRLAYRTRLTHSTLMASVIVDVAVLFLTVWSFHLQYQQPPAFYIKAPTLLYVFIFIALRSLSLVPGYVLFAGLLSALGWLALVGYAIAAPGGHALLTRDYVEYMTSTRILVGGEIDKVISILLVSGVLALAAARARGLLYQAVAEEQAADRLSRFFSAEIARSIVTSEDAVALGRGKQTQGAAMFVDLRGFTRLGSQLPPNELIALLGEYQGIVTPIIARHRGSVMTYLGDGIMATFGAMPPSESYGADALRAADELVESLGRWIDGRKRAGKPAPEVGIGVDSGTVTSGAIGDPQRLEYAVIGDPVNRAAKLQSQTKAENVRALTTAQTLERAVSQGYVLKRPRRALPARTVAGLSSAVDLVVIG